jgi:hypothetical protein
LGKVPTVLSEQGLAVTEAEAVEVPQGPVAEEPYLLADYTVVVAVEPTTALKQETAVVGQYA